MSQVRTFKKMLIEIKKKKPNKKYCHLYICSHTSLLQLTKKKNHN